MCMYVDALANGSKGRFIYTVCVMLCGFDGAVCRGTYMMFCEAVAQCVLEVRVRRSVPVKDVCVVFFNLFFCVILDRLLKCYMFVFIRP